jgi:chitodextrinase
VEDPVTLPSEINTRNGYKWFWDDGVVRESVDFEAPSRPGRLKAVVKSATKVRVRWLASEDNVGVVGYRVFRDGVEVGFSSDSFYVDRGLWPETEYEYKVYAVDAAGNVSARSRVRSAVTLADENPPSRPKNVTVSVGADSVFVDWDPASDNVAVSHYVVRVFGVVKVSTSDTSFLRAGLEPGTEYHIAVRAVDVFGNIGKRRHIYATTTTQQGTYDAISQNHSWRYLDNGSDQGTSWRAAGFNDSNWSTGVGEFGYGDGDETTVVASGLSDDRHITTYFRASFGVANTDMVDGLRLRLVRDDGAVIYLNGVEVYRNNMPAGVVDAGTLASSGVSGSDEENWIVVSIPTSDLVNGANVLAAEVHQVHPTSSDLSFAATLTVNP